METPLTPLEFARRARKLYGDREGVVDGDLRLTYEEFFTRCDRWSSALQAMGVRQGDRVAYIAPNTHEQLEAFYAVPQIGAVLVHFHLTVGDRYLWTLPMFHANGWTFVWIITAVGGTHVCLPKVEPPRVFDLIRKENIGWLCAAPTVLIALANSPTDVRGDVPKGVHVITAGAAPAAATIERLEGELDWEVTQVYGLTGTAPFITLCEPGPEHRNLGTAALGVIQ